MTDRRTSERDGAFEVHRWRGFLLPSALGFLVGCAAAPLVRVLIAFLVQSFRP